MAFQLQQPPLPLQPRTETAGTARGHHAVARDEKHDRIRPAGLTHGTHGVRRTGYSSDLAVGPYFAERNAMERLPRTNEKRRTPGKIEGLPRHIDARSRKPSTQQLRQPSAGLAFAILQPWAGPVPDRSLPLPRLPAFLGQGFWQSQFAQARIRKGGRPHPQWGGQPVDSRFDTFHAVGSRHAKYRGNSAPHRPYDRRRPCQRGSTATGGSQWSSRLRHDMV